MTTATQQRYVLVVDDEDHIREIAKLSLETVGGWQVEAVGSGREAIASAAAARPDAILLDVMMPGMDGPATIRTLRADPATSMIPVVLLTAKVQGSDLAELHSTGALGILPKPFDPMMLAAQVSEILGWDD